MKIKSMDHIGIAVKDIESALGFYRDALGLKLEEIEVVEEQKVKVAFLPISEGEIELLETTEEDGPIAKYIENNGEGIHHIALRVENLEESLAELKSKGVSLIHEKPRKGAGGAKIAFLNPKSTGGVLLELCER
jgi:methylmalonyl-CoA/ethylmalonyl-CoA epimerase